MKMVMDYPKYMEIISHDLFPQETHTLVAMQKPAGRPELTRSWNQWRALYYRMRQHEANTNSRRPTRTHCTSAMVKFTSSKGPGVQRDQPILGRLLGVICCTTYPSHRHHPEDVRAHEYIFADPFGKVELKLQTGAGRGCAFLEGGWLGSSSGVDMLAKGAPVLWNLLTRLRSLSFVYLGEEWANSYGFSCCLLLSTNEKLDWIVGLKPQV